MTRSFFSPLLCLLACATVASAAEWYPHLPPASAPWVFEPRFYFLSGVVPVGDTHRRFNARFYIVAMIFLVFDVEIVFFYPWATLFPSAVGPVRGLLLGEMVIFVVILLVAYLYALGKGVFRWD